MSGAFDTDVLKLIYANEKRGVPLSNVQKILLAKTGTMEHLLGILTGAPVSVNVTKQSEERDIIRRQVIFLSHSGKPLIRATSKIHCKNLPTAVVRRLRCKKEGIGTILSTERVAVSRKVTRIGIKDGRPYREYVIFHRNKVCFEITEEILLKGGPGGI